MITYLISSRIIFADKIAAPKIININWTAIIHRASTEKVILIYSKNCEKIATLNYEKEIGHSKKIVGETHTTVSYQRRNQNNRVIRWNIINYVKFIDSLV